MPIAGSRSIKHVALRHPAGGRIGIDPLTAEAAQPYFELTIDLDAPADEFWLWHGMTGSVRIRAGAETIDLDGQKGYVRYQLFTARRIDFAAMEKATLGAGYTLKSIALETTGEVVRARCKTCNDERPFLKIDPTGQLLELDGTVAAGRLLRVHGSVSGWAENHAVLKVIRAVEVKREGR